MSRRRRNLLFVLIIVLAAAVSVGIWLTNPERSGRNAQRGRSSGWSRLVDQQPLQTAQALEKLATTREEARFSRDAINVADHAADLAFTTALRDAKEHPAAETPETRALHERIRNAERQVQADQQQIQQFTAALAARRNATAEDVQHALQLAQAELALHQDELEDAKHDLLRAGGDTEGRIQRLFNQHQTRFHGEPAQPATFTSRPAFQVPASMLAQLRLWMQLRNKELLLLDAQQQASASASDLTRKHDELEHRLNEGGASSPPAPTAAADSRSQHQSTASLVRLQHLTAERKTLSEYDQRIQDLQQLGQIYGEWAAVVGTQALGCVHGALNGLLWIVLIVAFVLVGNAVVGKFSTRFGRDRRSLATISLIGRFAVQAIGLVLILFVVLGSPGQLSTIIALAGAGLTVALKDFIVAFFGWFVLMGKNGIRVGDWVEINGIVGEVVEIGILRTVLLETGNWAEAGHPTGRRVTFVNSFAIDGHYFNFSTTGQWLWDTLEVTVPSGQDPYPIMDAVLQLIQRETGSTARLAEQEWQLATRNYGVQSFAAAPAINVRPSAQGTNIVVRYITRAHERFNLRTRLYQAVVDLLHGRKQPSEKIETAPVKVSEDAPS